MTRNVQNPVWNALDRAPSLEPRPTGYDLRHLLLYARLLDADDAGADLVEARRLLDLPRTMSGGRVRTMWLTHLERAQDILTGRVAFDQPTQSERPQR